MIERETMNSILNAWGRWQRSAKHPSQNYCVSQLDTPLMKKRDVKPIYKDETAEYLDRLICMYLPKEYCIILELSYVERKINTIAADILGCHRKTYEHKKNEAIAMLTGVYSVAVNQPDVACRAVR